MVHACSDGRVELGRISLGPRSKSVKRHDSTVSGGPPGHPRSGPAKVVDGRRCHQAGDEVLRRVVEAIQGTLRVEDALYRLGGEEFLVVLNVSSEDGLRAASERLRATVAGLGIVHKENRPHGVVSISLGATIIDRADLELTDDAWLARADQALYGAKAAGRNRVVCAPRAPAAEAAAAAVGSSAA